MFINNYKNINILIVDDDTTNLKVLGNSINKEGYNVEFALNGIEALKWLEQKNFDLILLDVNMPKMNGYEVCKKIKDEKKWENIPVIFLTAKNDIKSTIKAFNVGAVDYIIKPFNKTELLARIATQIKLKLLHDEINDYNQELEKINNRIAENISYAQIIQEAFLPEIKELQTKFPDSFIFYKPKDIVSGDFYWFKNIHNLTIVAVVDCTGHGVSGAIMSTIGYTALNEAVIQLNIIKPNEILDYMHKFISKFLNKTDGINSLPDGMDMAICVIDKNTNKVQFAGANLPVFMLQNKQLEKYSGNIWSIGQLFVSNIKFQLTEFTINEGSTIYMFTDGYCDQFGGVNEKKFNSKKFKKLLTEIHQKPIIEQVQILENTFESWRNGTIQIDDVTVLGLKYSTK